MTNPEPPLRAQETVVIVALVLALGFLGLVSTEPASPEPLELWSGAEWCAMTPASRFAYTAGLMTGLWFGAKGAQASEPSAERAVKEFFDSIATMFNRLPLEEVYQHLERFYANPSQRYVPIIKAIVAPEPNPDL